MGDDSDTDHNDKVIYNYNHDNDKENYDDDNKVNCEMWQKW